MSWKAEQDSLDAARKLDQQDPLSRFRKEFVFPNDSKIYFAGHSLGLMPRRTREYVVQEIDAWGELGVEGHFKAKKPWLPYHENVTSSLARLVGAKEAEVVAMNSLTTNLHLMMVSFYRPTGKRFKILIENNAFPSDKYAVDSQARFHGLNPKEAIVELKPRAGELVVRSEDVLDQLRKLGSSLALVMLGNCNYLSGQRFPFEAITKAAQESGAICGFNLAHGAGNLAMKLHDWNVDFAVWCSYKYLNSGPGAIAGAFVHERHLGKADLPRFEGWWGHNKQTRFKMGPLFDPLNTAEAWQLSNPPIFQLAALRASMEIFDEAGIESLRERGDRLTGYFEWLLKKSLGEAVEIVTPTDRGSMLCLRFKSDARGFAQALASHGVSVDFREPDIIRATPAPLYNSFEDVYQCVQILKEKLSDA